MLPPEKDGADEEEDWDLPGEVVGHVVYCLRLLSAFLIYMDTQTSLFSLPGEVVGDVVQQAEQLQVWLLEQVPRIERDIGLNHRQRLC